MFLGAWLKILRVCFARDCLSTSLFQILDTPLMCVLIDDLYLHMHEQKTMASIRVAHALIALLKHVHTSYTSLIIVFCQYESSATLL